MTVDELNQRLEAAVSATIRVMVDLYADELPRLETERKKGKWHVEGFKIWCANCGFHPTAIEVFKYCPSCGAEMEVDA